MTRPCCSRPDNGHSWGCTEWLLPTDEPGRPVVVHGCPEPSPEPELPGTRAVRAWLAKGRG